MGHELRQVSRPEDWEAMHRIRREVLFVPGRELGRFVYNDAHPHDLDPGHVKFLLMLDGRPVGTTRLDPRGNGAIVRLVAIISELQRRGHGSVLEELVSRFAADRGYRQLTVNSAGDAVGFYEKLGWRHEVWDEAELAAAGPTCVQLVKDIARN